MKNLLRLSPRVYNALLRVYPEELRREFGSEMALVFAEDLEAARRDEGVRGVLRVWLCALYEFLRFGLPGQIENPAVMVPVITFAIGVLTQSGGVLLDLRKAHALGIPIGHLTGVWAGALLLTNLLSALISLAAVRACRSRAAASLGLKEQAS